MPGAELRREDRGDVHAARAGSRPGPTAGCVSWNESVIVSLTPSPFGENAAGVATKRAERAIDGDVGGLRRRRDAADRRRAETDELVAAVREDADVPLVRRSARQAAGAESSVSSGSPPVLAVTVTVTCAAAASVKLTVVAMPGPVGGRRDRRRRHGQARHEPATTGHDGVGRRRRRRRGCRRRGAGVGEQASARLDAGIAPPSVPCAGKHASAPRPSASGTAPCPPSRSSRSSRRASSGRCRARRPSRSRWSTVTVHGSAEESRPWKRIGPPSAPLAVTE